jgi:hypothetical protein
MSEPVTEPTTEPTEPVEPAVEPTDPTEPVEPTEEPTEPAEPTEPTVPGEEPVPGEEQGVEMRSQKELEKSRKMIETLRKHVAGRLGDIMGDEAVFLIPCPVCGDGFPGHVFPPDVAPPDPETIGAVSAYIGLPDLTQLEDALDAIPCPDCRARGEVKTGSLVPAQTTKMCSRCVGKGWIGSGSFVSPETGTKNGSPTEQTTYVPPTETALPPEAEALRRQGFLVIPPSQPIAV